MTNTYITVGSGPHKVIVLHGWFGSAEAWQPFCDVLDPREFTYVFMDYRGYGRSKSLIGKYTIAEVSGDAIALADKLGWDRFSLVGHSMGGKFIQQVLLDAPGRVRKLVAITPVPASASPFDEQRWAIFSSAASDPAVRRSIIDLTTGKRLSGYWLEKMVANSLQSSNVNAFAGYLKTWAKTDFAEMVKGNPISIKVIVGEYDPSLTVDLMTQTYLQWYPNAVLEQLSNAGHYPMDETPVALATSIENFLRD